jgi:hypothetical protein
VTSKEGDLEMGCSLSKNILMAVFLLGLGAVVGSLFVFSGNENGPVATYTEENIELPLKVSLYWDKDELAIGNEFRVTVAFTPLRDVPGAKAQIETSGVVSLVSTPSMQWGPLSANEEITVQAVLLIEREGEGEIVADVLIVTESGQVLYDRLAFLYVLASPEVVLTNVESPWLLRLEYLDYALEAGIITQAEYYEEKEELLGGGAIETNE